MAAYSSQGGFAGDKIPKGYKTGQMQNFDPQQMELYRNMFSNVSPDSFLSKIAGGDQSAFDEMEAPAWRQFQEAQGQLASRFSGQGMGGRSSSAFQNASGQLGSDFAMNLQAQRQQLRQQALKDLMGYSSEMLGQRPYERFMVEKPKKFDWGQFAGQMAGAIPGVISSFATGGNPSTAIQGATSTFGGGSTGGGSYSYGGNAGNGGISTSSNRLMY